MRNNPLSLELRDKRVCSGALRDDDIMAERFSTCVR